MSSRQARTARRAAERPNQFTPQTASPARMEANRANAQFSIGPKTPEGKTKSSLNAIRTGLTGRTVLLPADDIAAYEAHIQSFVARHNPSGDREHELVQGLADTQWRLNRIPSLEAGIYALGRIEFANKFDDQAEAPRASLIDAYVFLTYQKQLRNLSAQESRLRRQYQNDQKELVELQRLRQAAEASKKPSLQATHVFTPALLDNGFVFTTDESDSLQTLFVDESAA